MARSLNDIRREAGDAYAGNEFVKHYYNLPDGASFDRHFNASAIESVLLYATSFVAWVVERLFDVHRAEVEERLLAKTPHTARWYRDKVLRFQYPNRRLVADTDRYDNTGLSDDDIAALEVVKYCAVTDRLSKLLVKVAKGEAGNRRVLTGEEEEALKYYIAEVRDAGVEVEVINRQADKFFARVNVYYDPLVLSPSEKPVENAVRAYISNLDFNAALSTTRLVDTIQQVGGVVLVDVLSASVQRADNPKDALGVQKIADSGYWVVANDADLVITYKPHSNADI